MERDSCFDHGRGGRSTFKIPIQIQTPPFVQNHNIQASLAATGVAMSSANWTITAVCFDVHMLLKSTTLASPSLVVTQPRQ